MTELTAALAEVRDWATRIAKSPGIEINFCGKGAPNRLWFWPEHKFKALPVADREFERAHRTELKELVRAGLAPRLADVQASVLVCSFCRRVCVGAGHPAYDTLHNSDPEVIARKDKAATAEMLAAMRSDPDAATALRRLVTNWGRYRY
jgi:hypothetical protein